MSYIKINNNLFSLSANEFIVYCGLMSFANKLGWAYCRVSTLAKRCNISEKSVLRATKSLSDAKVISVEKRYSSFCHRRSNKYMLSIPHKNYCLIDSNVFDLELTPTTFKIFLFLLRCAGKKNVAFPSLRKMVKELNLSIDTIIEKIDYLVATDLLTKKSIIKEQTQSFGVNNYFISQKFCLDKYLEKLSTLVEIIKVVRTIISKGSIVLKNISLLHELSFRPRHSLLAI